MQRRPMQTTTWLLALGLLAGLPAAPRTWARTWTSVSGATVEAEFVELDGENAILGRANGERFLISLSKLSEGDREHIGSLTRPNGDRGGDADSAPDAEEVPAAVAPLRLFGEATIRRAPPARAGDLPAIELRQPDTATRWAFQFGPNEGDIAYFVFDSPGLDLLHDTLYVYSPSQPHYRTPQKIVGKKVSLGEDKVRRFSGISLAAKNGTLNTRFILDLTYGVVRIDILGVVVNVELSAAGGGVSRFAYGGYINEQLGVGGEEAFEVFPALQEIRLGASVKANLAPAQGSVSLKMGPMNLVPGKGVDKAIRVELVDAEGKIRERFKTEPAREDLLSEGGTQYSFNLEKAKPGKDYTMKASIDLGPVVGPMESRSSFTGPEEFDLDE